MENATEIELVAKKKRFPVSLPPLMEAYLIWWSWCKAVSKTQLAQNTLQARIEANKEGIDAMLRENAEALGIPVKDLKEQILRKNRFDLASLVLAVFEDEEGGEDDGEDDEPQS